MKSLKDALDLMVALGYATIAVYPAPGGGDEIPAIVFAESDDALRITLSRPEDWEIWRKQ